MKIRGSAANLNFRIGRDEVEKLDDVLVVHPHTTDRARLAHLGAGRRAVDVDVAAHRIDVAEAVFARFAPGKPQDPVSYTHLRAHETPEHLVCRFLLEKKKER